MTEYEGLLKKIYKIWLHIGHILGTINSKIILTFIYYFIFSPAAMIMRLFKKDILKLKWESEIETYRTQPDHISISQNPY